jgi:RNA polymerase sigma-70 factor (ECF subfamily)
MTLRPVSESTAGPGDAGDLDQSATIRLEILRSMARLRRVAQSMTTSRADAEDLLQATCLRALERCRFLRHSSNVLSWLMRIMRNLRIDDARRIGEMVSASNGCPEAPADPAEPMPLWRLADDSFLDRAVPTLSPRFRSVWELTHVDKLRQSEIALRLGIDVNTVASRMYRARAVLRGRLLEECRVGASPALLSVIDAHDAERPQPFETRRRGVARAAAVEAAR